jgi:hypothetical protein
VNNHRGEFLLIAQREFVTPLGGQAQSQTRVFCCRLKTAAFPSTLTLLWEGLAERLTAAFDGGDSTSGIQNNAQSAACDERVVAIDSRSWMISTVNSTSRFLPSGGPDL